MRSVNWLYGGLFALVGAVAMPAQAQTTPGVPGEYQQAPRWYIGGNVGYTEYDEDLDEDWGYKVYGGYQFNQWLSGQIGYTNLGEFESDINGGEVEVDGFEAAAVGRLPLSDRFSALGKVGAYAWDTSVDGNGIPVEEDDGTEVTYGVGTEYQLNDQFAMRLEVERYADVAEEDLDMLSVGAMVRF